MYIYDNKTQLYQWDLNQKIVVENELVKEVHFTNASLGKALVVEVVDSMANVPNILLQQAWDIKAYGYCGECVRESLVINVIARSKPEDYTYTETELKTWDRLEEEIHAAIDTLNDDEEARVNAELSRIEAEYSRVIAEINREVAEENRQNTFNELKADLDVAIEGANLATEETKAATANANKAIASIGNVNKTFSNALVGKATGEIVSITDISPVEHTLDVEVRSKNLIPYPFRNTTLTKNGITFTDNGDGTITANGTATANAIYILHYYSIPLKTGTYTISSLPSDGSHSTFMTQIATMGGFAKNDVTAKGTTFTLNEDVNDLVIQLVIFNGYTADNLVFKPQIEVGSVATEYTPYVDVSTVNVKACGKNLIPFPYKNTTETINGVNFTVNSDGTITANGTATAQVLFWLCQSVDLVKANETYVMSGCASGGSGSTYMMEVSCGGQYPQDYGTGRSFVANSNTISMYIVIRSGATVNNLVFKPQLEVGTTATEYEPYKEPITYSANEEITSIYPTTTLFTDTTGAVIDVEYNRDLNKAFEELTQAIISLGGNV